MKHRWGEKKDLALCGDANRLELTQLCLLTVLIIVFDANNIVEAVIKAKHMFEKRVRI